MLLQNLWGLTFSRHSVIPVKFPVEVVILLSMLYPEAVAMLTSYIIV